MCVVVVSNQVWPVAHTHVFTYIKLYIYISFPEIIKVYDGNGSFRRRIFRLICVSRQSTTEELLTAALREFRITKDPGES